MPSRILIVDDNPDDAKLIEHAVPAALDFVYVAAEDLASAEPHLRAGVHLVILDLHLPDMLPSGAAPEISRVREFAPVMCITGLDPVNHPTIVDTCIGAGAEDVVGKNWIVENGPEFGRRLHLALAKARLGTSPRPNDLHTQLAMVVREVTANRTTNEGLIADQNRTLERIEGQVTKTNGRVGRLEKWQSRILWTGSVVTGLFVLVWLLAGHEIKGGVTHILHPPSPWTERDQRSWAGKLGEKNPSLNIPETQHEDETPKP